MNCKLWTVLSFLTLFVLGITACDPGLRGHGDILSETRQADNFHGLDISVPGKIVAHTGSNYAVTVQAEENILPYLRTEVKNGRLEVYFSRNVWDVDNLRVDVTAPNFDSFILSGSADIEMHDTISGNLLTQDISGSGNIDVDYADFSRIEPSISGSGCITLHGQTDYLDASVTGSGDIFALGCLAKNAEVHISGSGDVQCHPIESLNVHISGSGNVIYDGNPTVDANISGSGKVKHL